MEYETQHFKKSNIDIRKTVHNVQYCRLNEPLTEREDRDMYTLL